MHGKEKQHLVIGRQAVVAGPYFIQDLLLRGVRHELPGEAEIGFQFGFELLGFASGFGQFRPAGLEIGDVEKYGVVLARAGLGGEAWGKEERVAEKQENFSHFDTLGGRWRANKGKVKS